MWRRGSQLCGPRSAPPTDVAAASLISRVDGQLSELSDADLDRRLVEVRLLLRRFAQERPPTVERARRAVVETCSRARGEIRERLTALSMIQAPIEQLSAELHKVGVLAGVASLEREWLRVVDVAAEEGRLLDMTIADEEKQAAELRRAIDRLERERERRRIDGQLAEDWST